MGLNTTHVLTDCASAVVQSQGNIITYNTVIAALELLAQRRPVRGGTACSYAEVSLVLDIQLWHVPLLVEHRLFEVV